MPEYKGNIKYENLGLLGEGAQGAVFRVKRKSDGKLFAMKQVDMLALKQDKKNEVETECKIHCSLGHQSIVKADSYEYNDEKKKEYLFIYMEICAGGDLDALINQRGLTMDYFPEVDIWIYAAQMVDVLDYLHNSAADKSGRHLMHRDLKPANIFLAENQRELRLGDFGLATRIPKDGVVTGDVGTPEYMAPEVINVTPYDKAADCYSLGAIIHELATLEYLVDEGSSKNNMDRIRKKINAGFDVQIPDHYSPEPHNLIASLVSTKPSERPTAAELMNNPGIQWGLTQLKLDESRTCHEATIKRLTENKKAARARDQKKDVQIKELQAQLLALQQATGQRLAEIELREKNIAAREADTHKVERRQAQVKRYLDDKEKKFHQDRVALEQLRKSIASRTEHTSNDSPQGSSASCISRESHSSTCASVSEVSIELARCISVSSRASGHQEPVVSCSGDAPGSSVVSVTAPPSERNAVRRRANTGNLHRRYAPELQFQQSQIPVPAVCVERKLPSEGDLQEILSASKKSNIPISIRMKQLGAQAAQVVSKPESKLQIKQADALKPSKTAIQRLAVVASPTVARPRYNTRSVARNANKAGALPRLWI